MIKIVFATLLFALVVSAQVSRRREETENSEDPIGNFRARIRGWVARDKPEVDFIGFAERLEDTKTQTMLTHVAVELLPKGTDINQAKKLNGPIMQTFSFERQDSIDFFLNVAKSQKDVGQCFYAFVGEKANLRLGEWQTEKNKCGKQKTGTLYVRQSNFTDSKGDEIVQAEAFCKTQEKLLWFEVSTVINDEPQYVLHADVLEESEKPELQMPDLLSFSIPAICVLKPQVINDQMDLSRRILRALGVNTQRSGESSSSTTAPKESEENVNVPKENVNVPKENVNVPEESASNENLNEENRSETLNRPRRRPSTSARNERIQ